jgi:hypothetical protein
MNGLSPTLSREIDRETGDILREAERSVWSDPRQRAAIRAALQISNPALLEKLTGGMAPPEPNSP